MRLALQTSEPIGIVGQIRGKNLDGDVTVQGRVVRTVDIAHAAGAQRLDDLVMA